MESYPNRDSIRSNESNSLDFTHSYSNGILDTLDFFSPDFVVPVTPSTSTSSEQEENHSDFVNSILQSNSDNGVINCFKNQDEVNSSPLSSGDTPRDVARPLLSSNDSMSPLFQDSPGDTLNSVRDRSRTPLMVPQLFSTATASASSPIFLPQFSSSSDQQMYLQQQFDRQTQQFQHIQQIQRQQQLQQQQRVQLQLHHKLQQFNLQRQHQQQIHYQQVQDQQQVHDHQQLHDRQQVQDFQQQQIHDRQQLHDHQQQQQIHDRQQQMQQHMQQRRSSALYQQQQIASLMKSGEPPPDQETLPPDKELEDYVEITPYLTLSQEEASKKLGIPSSTLSKRWREATNNRKWPYRSLYKLDREIKTLMQNISSGEGNATTHANLSLLLRQRQEEGKTVYIKKSRN